MLSEAIVMLRKAIVMLSEAKHLCYRRFFAAAQNDSFYLVTLVESPHRTHGVPVVYVLVLAAPVPTAKVEPVRCLIHVIRDVCGLGRRPVVTCAKLVSAAKFDCFVYVKGFACTLAVFVNLEQLCNARDNLHADI